MKSQDRERIQVEVVSRVVDHHVQAARTATEGYLETLVNDTLYHERRRLEHAKSARAAEESAYYEEVLKKMQHASERDLRQLLEDLARRFAGEVVGNFDNRVYKAATGAIPAGLWLLLNAMSPRRLLSLSGLRNGIKEHLLLEGATDHVKALADRGTLVFVPTHSSNLDSILIGYAIYLLNLPPVIYGAGLNLFSNPLISFFMNNLGAYKVDRKKTSRLYKEVLKIYSTVSMELGYNSLFFPGGTRSRSGAVETKLKRGLLGTTVQAYVGNLRSGRFSPNLYIVPVTINYGLVLEAATLIDDHLKEVGKSRYIIEDDEFSKPRLVYEFLTKLISLDSQIVLGFSTPMDVFGNKVDVEGRSLDARGRVVDAARYVTHDGEPVLDEQRDHQYTNELSSGIVAAFQRDTVVMSTNVTARALFALLTRHNPGVDLYRLLRTGGELTSFPMAEVHQEVDRLMGILRNNDNGPRLGQTVAHGDAAEIVGDALRAFSIFHAHPAAARRGDRIFHEDRNLLLFYSNRLNGYPV